MVFTAKQQEVRRWLKERRAVMLAHNYQPGEIQDVADRLFAAAVGPPSGSGGSGTRSTVYGMRRAARECS